MPTLAAADALDKKPCLFRPRSDGNSARVHVEAPLKQLLDSLNVALLSIQFSCNTTYRAAIDLVTLLLSSALPLPLQRTMNSTWRSAPPVNAPCRQGRP